LKVLEPNELKSVVKELAEGTIKIKKQIDKN
jgi:hypothetical protein